MMILNAVTDQIEEEDEILLAVAEEVCGLFFKELELNFYVWCVLSLH